ncbi:hypothetical protein FQN54_005498 [Arachnomyces sp. PD_36]|nr:hypothetical protein FQN54_005498 [Arachnomyces sp. PD_36]
MNSEMFALSYLIKATLTNEKDSSAAGSRSLGELIIRDRIGLDEADVQRWTSTLLAVFGAALLAGSPLSGWWADKVERRAIPFLAGLVLLTGATVMLCLARSIPVLIVARVFQGLSGSIVWTVAIAIMTDRVGTQKFGAIMGLITVARSAGVLLGPIIGGVLYAKAGYYAVFGTLFGLLGADVLFRCVLIETRKAQKWDPSIGPEVDKSESAMDGSDEQESIESEKPMELSGRKRGSLYRLAHSLPPFVTLLGSIRLVVALWGCFVQAIVLGCMDAVLPLFVHGIFNWGSTGAGLLFFALMVPTLVSPVFGWLTDNYGPRWYAAGGLLVTAIPLILLRLVTHDSVDQKALLCVLLALVGAFTTCFEIPLCVDVLRAVELKGEEDPKKYGGKGAYAQAFGLNNMVWAAGMVVGPIWGGFVFENAGWGTLTWTLGLVSAVSAIPAAIYVGGNIFGESRKLCISASSSTAVLVDDGGEMGYLKDAAKLKICS